MPNCSPKWSLYPLALPPAMVQMTHFYMSSSTHGINKLISSPKLMDIMAISLLFHSEICLLCEELRIFPSVIDHEGFLL